MRAPARLRLLLPVAAAVLTAAPALAGVPAAGSGTSATAGSALRSHGLVVARGPGVPPAPPVSASSYVLADLDTGEVLAAKDAHGYYAPASTLKTLTALTLVPKLDPAGTVVATWEDANVDGSKVGVQPGKRYRISDLFQAMLMVSGNDAALTLATANGGIPQTVQQMNEVAHSIGANDTVALTPNGLDAKGQHSSAYDLALIARQGLQLPAFADYVKTRRSHFGAFGAKAFEIYTHNKLVLRYPGAFGVKNGYTVAARASFVGAAARGNDRLVVALMHADPTVWQEAAKLLTWGFANRQRLTPVGTLQTPSTEIASAPDSGTTTTHSVTRESSREPSRSGFSVPLAPAAAAGAVLVGFVALRRASTRSRRRRGGRLRLPPI